MGKKILIFADHVGGGGAERVLSNLANFWTQAGNEIVIVQTDFAEIDKNYALSDSIQIINMPPESHWKPLRYLIETIRFTQLLRIMPDFTILCFLMPKQFLCALASLFVKNRMVFSERNTPWLYPRKKLHRMLRDWSFTRIDACVFQTPDAMHCFSRSIQKKSVIIPNPVSPALPEPYSGTRRKVVVTACRLAPQKNLPLLFRAFAQVHAEFPEYTLEVYGRGDNLEALQTLKQRLNLTDSIRLMGFSHHLHEQIRDAAMYVSSSNYEGISNSMLEAVALGIPTISTDCPVGGARITIQDGVNGLLVPVGDEQALYQAMKKLILNPELAQSISYKGTELRQTLNLAEIAKQWLELL